MRLTSVLLDAPDQGNTMFPTPLGPVAPLTDVLRAILTAIRAQVHDRAFEDTLSKLEAGEQEWLNSIFRSVAGYRPPLIVDRVPHKVNGHLRHGYFDLHVFVGRPIELLDALAIQAEEGEDPRALREKLIQDPLKLRGIAYRHVTGILYDENDPNTAFYPMLSDMLCEAIEEILAALDTTAPLPDHIASGRPRRLGQIADIVRALNEWHTSLSLAQDTKLGLSPITARVLALDTVQTVEGTRHNAFAFGKRSLNWKRDFRRIARRTTNEEVIQPIGGINRLNQRRVWTLQGWLGFTTPADLVDEPLHFPRNTEYLHAAKAYADHLDAEVWTAKSSPNEDDRPLRPINWAHVTEVDKTPMSTAGKVILSTETNILETIIILEDPAAIITERWAIISGEVPQSHAAALIGQPLSKLIDHPLLEPIVDEPDTQIIIRDIKQLIGETAQLNHNNCDSDRAAWEALAQYFKLAKLPTPPFLRALGTQPGASMSNTPIPGCTVILYEERAILGDTPTGTITIRPRDAGALKRSFDFRKSIK